jgi:hypothetical protein
MSADARLNLSVCMSAYMCMSVRACVRASVFGHEWAREGAMNKHVSFFGRGE